MYWLQVSMSMCEMPPPKRSAPVSTMMRQGRSGGALNGNRQLDAAGGAEDLQRAGRSTICVLHVPAACPAPKSSRIEVRRSVPMSGSRSTAPVTRSGSRPKMKREVLIEIAADVHQRAAAGAGPVADVRGVAVEVAEDARASIAARRCAPLATRSLTVSHCGCVRTMNASWILTPVRSRTAMSSRASSADERDRLLAQHVLAVLGRLDRPGHVQVVRQRVVDGVDVGVGEQLFVRSVGLRDAQRRGRGRCAFSRSRDAIAVTSRPLAALHGRDDFVGRDLRDAEHAPTNFAHRW